MSLDTPICSDNFLAPKRRQQQQYHLTLFGDLEPFLLDLLKHTPQAPLLTLVFEYTFN